MSSLQNSKSRFRVNQFQWLHAPLAAVNFTLIFIISDIAEHFTVLSQSLSVIQAGTAGRDSYQHEVEQQSSLTSLVQSPEYSPLATDIIFTQLTLHHMHCAADKTDRHGRAGLGQLSFSLLPPPCSKWYDVGMSSSGYLVRNQYLYYFTVIRSVWCSKCCPSVPFVVAIFAV